MNAGICAAGAMQCRFLTCDAGDRLFHALLHTWPVFLALEPLKRRAVKFDRKREPGQTSTRLLETGRPRRKLPISIAGLPAR